MDVDNNTKNSDELLELLCADPQIDIPLPEDIDNYGGNTDESNYIEDYQKKAKQTKL